MNEPTLRDMLARFKDGKVDLDTVVTALQRLPFEDVISSGGRSCVSARVDHHRELRCGFGEVIFCMGKTVQQVQDIFAKLAATGQNVLATRADREMFDAVASDFPAAEFHETPRAITLVQKPIDPVGHVAIIAAGTSDLPVAEEARVTAEIMGANVTTHYDMGVAGLHRLLADLPEIHKAKALVAVAGMEGALASVVGGLVSAPVIAVPTSVGYGASFEGLAALLTMLNSCAAGVSVVNIDNGFGGGYNAALINRT